GRVELDVGAHVLAVHGAVGLHGAVEADPGGYSDRAGEERHRGGVLLVVADDLLALEEGGEPARAVPRGDHALRAAAVAVPAVVAQVRGQHENLAHGGGRRHRVGLRERLYRGGNRDRRGGRALRARGGQARGGGRGHGRRADRVAEPGGHPGGKDPGGGGDVEAKRGGGLRAVRAAEAEPGRVGQAGQPRLGVGRLDGDRRGAGRAGDRARQQRADALVAAEGR